MRALEHSRVKKNVTAQVRMHAQGLYRFERRQKHQATDGPLQGPLIIVIPTPVMRELGA